ncbi:MAG: transposase [Pedosphaera sp.]|nr:transposase [Pedosphaera sp.]
MSHRCHKPVTCEKDKRDVTREKSTAPVGSTAFPTDLAEWVGAVNLMSFALEATADVRLDAVNFSAGIQPDTFPTRMLFTLLAYSYARGLYSSQDIEDGCCRSKDLRYLCAGDLPDAATIRRFRRLHWSELQSVLSRLLQRATCGQDVGTFISTGPEALNRLSNSVRTDSLLMEH